MQNPSEDTEWNDALRRHGILPQKESEVTEDQLINMVEETVQKRTGMNVVKAYEDMSLDELEELEDEEDERVLLQYRQQRMAEIQKLQKASKFGDVREISAQDYVDEVNKAGKGVWVVLHLYKSGIPLCALINQYFSRLAQKFPATKFLKSISTTCIPNYPDKHLPTIFIYFEDDMKRQFVGPLVFGGMSLKIDGFHRALDLSPLHVQKSCGLRLESQQKTLCPEKSYESGVHPNDFVIVYCSLVNSVLERAAAALAILPNHLANDMEKIQKCTLSIIYPFTSFEDESLGLHQHCDVTELEWMLSEAGAVKTDLEENPRKKNKIHDVMTSSLRQANVKDSDSDDDNDD